MCAAESSPYRSASRTSRRRPLYLQVEQLESRNLLAQLVLLSDAYVTNSHLKVSYVDSQYNVDEAYERSGIADGYVSDGAMVMGRNPGTYPYSSAGTNGPFASTGMTEVEAESYMPRSRDSSNLDPLGPLEILNAQGTAYAKRSQTFEVRTQTGETIGEIVSIEFTVIVQTVGNGVAKASANEWTTSGTYTVKIGDTITVSMESIAEMQGDLYTTSDNKARAATALKIVPLPDIAVSALNWRDAAAGGGVELPYSIVGEDLPQAANIAFYWAGSPDETTGPTAAPNQTTPTEVGSYQIVIPASQFYSPKDGKTYLIAVADFSNEIVESHETNNVSSAKLIIPAPSIQITVSPQMPMKKQQFTPKVEVTNNAPVPLEYSIDWISTFEQLVYEGFTGPAVTATGPGRPITYGIEEVGRESDQTAKSEPLQPGLPTDVKLFTSPLAVHWLWIDPKNPIRDDLGFLDQVLESAKDHALESLEEFLEDISGITLGVLRNEGMTIYEVANAILSVLANPGRELDVNLEVKVNPSVDSSVAVSQEVNLELRVAQQHKDYFAFYLLDATAGNMALSAGIGAIAGFIVKKDSALLAEALAYFTSATALLRRASDMYENAKDPPDSDFRVIAMPEVKKVEVVESLPDGPLKEYARMSLELEAVTQAAYLSQNRADGAAEVQDSVWQARQLAAAGRYSAQAAVLQARVVTLKSQVDEHFTQDVLSQAVVVDYLRTNGLPEEAVANLGQLGWASDWIEKFKAKYAATAALRTQKAEPTSRAMKVEALLSNYSALGLLSQSAAIEIRDLGLVARTITDSEQAELNAAHADIDAELARGIPSRLLEDKISSFYERLRTLVQDSHNPAALQAEWDYGYAAMNRFVAFDPGIPGLKEEIAKGKSVGTISDAADATLLQNIGSLEASLKGANYAAYVANLTSLLDTIERLRDSGVAAGEADALRDYALYLKDLAGKWLFPWHNSTPLRTSGEVGFDVNADGVVSPIDALIVINHLNTNLGQSAVPQDAAVGGPFAKQGQPSFVDVNGDNFVAPIDVLLVINWVNSNGSRLAGEGEASAVADSSWGEVSPKPSEAMNVREAPAINCSPSFDDLLSELAMDSASSRRRRY